ncbi:MAG TPA: T9SS type A sorting domain-containing protein [Chitinophagaceae bacterium]|nr:T9SS type A sorting domain-containing protein [Chitinophagaceae bacterium]
MNKGILILCYLLCIFYKTKSQVTYTVDSIPFKYELLDDPTFVIVGVDDIHSNNIPLAFQFNYFGINYDKFNVSSNGTISFNELVAGQYNSWHLDSVLLPSPFITFRNSIMIPHQDILPTNINAKIQYQVKGSAPYRRLIVSYDSISYFSCTSLMFSAQAILYETTNTIDINIKEKHICPGWNNGFAVLGIEDSSGTIAYSPLGRIGKTQWTAYSESWRFKPSNAGPENPLTCTLKGRVYIDKNSDCISNSSEVGVVGRFIELDNGMMTFTDNKGNFEFNVDTGVYKLKAYTQPYIASTCSPSSYNIHFTTKDSTVANLNFSLAHDTCIKVSTMISIFPIEYCKSNRIRINCRNAGTNIQEGVYFRVVLPDSTNALDFNPIPTFTSPSYLNYYIGTLRPGENKTLEFTEIYDCNLWADKIRCYSTRFEGNIVNCDTIILESQSCYFGQMLSKSANSMETMRTERKELGFVKYSNYKAGERFDFKINFANQMDTLANEILIENKLDTTLFDISTLAFQGATHKGTFIPSSDRFQFLIKSIGLPFYANDTLNSQGALRYSIQLKKNMDGTKVIPNKASIRFNMNQAIQTNDCVLLPEPKISPTVVTDYFTVGPNPIHTNIYLNIHSYKKYEFAEIYNVIGQRVYKQALAQTETIMNVAHLHAGIYSIKIFNLTGDILIQKIVKR